MKIFISWSGTKSQRIAEALSRWLRSVFHGVAPWVSSDSIGAGSRWLMELSRSLENTNFGILCVTRENMESPWLLFEAGALSKSLEHGKVVPYLIDLIPSDLRGPLSQFQAVVADEAGTKKLFWEISASHSAGERREDDLNGLFKMCWPTLQSQINELEERQTPERSESQSLLPLPPKRKTKSGKRHDLRFRFWQQLLELAKKKNLPFHAGRSPTTAHWVGGAVGIPGYSWNYVVWMQQAVAVELCIDTQDEAENKRAFDALYQHRSPIEAFFGAGLEWNRLNDCRRSEVRFTIRAGGLTAPEESWPAIQLAMVNSMARLTGALQPHLQPREV